MSDGARGGARPSARPPHPATVAQSRAQHPATVAQPKAPHPAKAAPGEGRPPHPATVVQQKVVQRSGIDFLVRLSDMGPGGAQKWLTGTSPFEGGPQFDGPGVVITKEGLNADDYLYVDAAVQGGEIVSEPPPGTAVKMKVLVLKKQDISWKDTGEPIQAVLSSPKRNDTSISPIHNNAQNRLPMYKFDTQPYMEYFGGIGASRIIVDVVSTKVYLSYHYGDDSAGKGTVPKWAKKGSFSAFVELDPDTWYLPTIIKDARSWWRECKLQQVWYD